MLFVLQYIEYFFNYYIIIFVFCFNFVLQLNTPFISTVNKRVIGIMFKHILMQAQNSKPIKLTNPPTNKYNTTLWQGQQMYQKKKGV